MGKLAYGFTEEYVFDDHTLAHLRSVIVAKLVRQESFVFTWQDETQQHSIWLHPGAHIRFVFDDQRQLKLNRRWLESLAELANTPSGLRLTPEPEPYEETGVNETV